MKIYRELAFYGLNLIRCYSSEYVEISNNIFFAECYNIMYIHSLTVLLHVYQYYQLNNTLDEPYPNSRMVPISLLYQMIKKYSRTKDAHFKKIGA